MDTLLRLGNDLSNPGNYVLSPFTLLPSQMTLKQIQQLITTAQDSCEVHVTTLLHEDKMG